MGDSLLPVSVGELSVSLVLSLGCFDFSFVLINPLDGQLVLGSGGLSAAVFPDTGMDLLDQILNSFNLSSLESQVPFAELFLVQVLALLF